MDNKVVVNEQKLILAYTPIYDNGVSRSKFRNFVTNDDVDMVHLLDSGWTVARETPLITPSNCMDSLFTIIVIERQVKM